MPVPASILPAKPRVHRKRREGPTPTPPPAALTLVSASYAEGESVTLTFDRAVDAAGLDAPQVVVHDAAGSGFVMVGAGVASVPSPQSVVIALAPTDSAEGLTVLDATAATGIVAVDDGGTWAGATGLELPFP